MAKGSTEAKNELEHALAISFNASSVEMLKDEASVGPLVTCTCRRHSADISTRLNHEAFFPELRS